jgi:hypothetical protein
MDVWKKIKKIPGRKRYMMAGDEVVGIVTMAATYEIEGRYASEDEYCMQRYINRRIKTKEKYHSTQNNPKNVL